MKLLFLKEGFTIFCSKHNETHKEIIFGLDDKNQPIQHFTFQDEFVYSKNELDAITERCETVNLENGYLLYSFLYEKSYAHYLTQTIPKLYDYLNEYSHCNLLIPKSRYNNLCKDILKNLNINNVILLENEVIYNINNFISTKIYEAPPASFVNAHVGIYNKIRNNLNITPNVLKNRNIYLKRDGFQSIDFGNDETGINRHIINENELINELQKKKI